ncbi:PAS domain-containing sensor histidine kinase [Flammeovirga kamogawensis]|uniref:histidine kinase n=1 Tax=Flammeovirga kamogawensis TaxID=373891 RepID=A0ABX8GQN6_9BACT|nr:ATP-binding protein [Flammeovirga kamogawensis]MBB6462141.1 PAS domain S-box-containing protein [Flammeovirga kamogawensis]QWG05875.1 PAS domain-containing protein [Flammeovirga kamogawensis]TRX67699.1 PAS domain-containing protein [Flammeovirga kamogawensis]
MKNNEINTQGTKNKLNSTLTNDEQSYFHLYNTSPDMFLSLNPKDKTVKFCNQTFSDRMNYSKDEVIGAPVFKFFHPDSFGMIQKKFTEFMETGILKNVELKLLTKDEKVIDVLLNTKAVKDVEGTILYSNSCFRDISDIIQLRKELSQKNLELEEKVIERTQELEHFVYAASHDLQEPLRNMSNCIDVLQSSYQDQLDATGKQFVKYISSSAQRMSNLIKGILNFSKTGKENALTSVDIAEIIDEIRSDFSLLLKESSTVFNVNNDMPVIKGYRMEVRLLFQNLISNAIKFRKRNEQLTISINSSVNEDGKKVFSIEDNGIGIKEEYFKRIFQIFKRLHNRDDFEGTGIGLAHCQKIVKLHDGEIWVESTYGKGSTFYFTLG